ncbi:hypothetical protein COR50_20170 [Chitinophaga caeni]|uniref:Esterase n=2 Tax=Chitinophaga caeni TaxID=2029983 RepID=A0A291QZN4_9BACT|nr:hypothetical protein COR50_20170 [Chitinophaga caeni]
MQMLRNYAIIFTLLFIGCAPGTDKKVAVQGTAAPTSTMNFYSESVKDSFSIFISLPEGYADNNQYPVVYILDANLYFDIFSTIVKKYSEVGLLPPAILVGIGYKDFPMMDSLRCRDYTYPLAIPEYEMSVSGKADKFLSFIRNELVPEIDTKYHVDKNKRVLMGHSLGGYFTLYALQQQLSSRDNLFGGYIAASPSLHYNHYYLLDAFEKLSKQDSNPAKVYTTFGGLEDGESTEDSTMLKTDESLSALSKSLKGKEGIEYKGEVFSNLDHMDTQLPSFVKGMQWVLQ